MKIENEIKQNQFRNEYQKLMINLIYTYNVISSRMQDLLLNEQLTMQQYNILRILRGQYPNPATNGLVKERMLDRNSDVTRIIDRMIKSGLVTRANCESDRRRVDILITQKGLDLLSRLDARVNEMEALVMTVNEDEAIEINRLLDKLRGSES